MPEDFEYKVRRKIEELSRSKEMENIKRDFKNMADDVKREFSSYCSEGRFNNEKTVAPEHGGLTRIKRKKVQTVTMRRKNMCPKATMHKITTIIMGQIRAKIQSRYSHTKHSVYPVYCSPFLAELVWEFLPCFCW